MFNRYAFLADLIVGFHMLYVAFAVGGELLIVIGWILRWRWIRGRVFRIAHLIAVVVVSIESMADVLCPITEWEYRLRVLAGQTAEQDITFIGRLIRLVVYYDLPDWAFSVMYIGFGVLVALTFFLIPPYWGRQNERTSRADRKDRG